MTTCVLLSAFSVAQICPMSHTISTVNWLSDSGWLNRMCDTGPYRLSIASFDVDNVPHVAFNAVSLDLLTAFGS